MAVIMIDNRCPQCNRPVRTGQEVTSHRELPKYPKQCRLCKAGVVLVQDAIERGFEEFVSYSLRTTS